MSRFEGTAPLIELRAVTQSCGGSAHQRHDDDPRFKAFLEKATRLHAMKLLVFFGTAVFERRHQFGFARG
jgi:hypothetical protein